MRCYRKILHISHKDHVTDEEVRAKIQQAIGPHEDLLTIVKRCKLQWCGHISRSSGLAKTISRGTVRGGRRQGGQRKRLEDNIREWTGLEFGKSQRAVENRDKWRKLVTKSSVVPQRPSWLRDWWWWWWWKRTLFFSWTIHNKVQNFEVGLFFKRHTFILHELTITEQRSSFFFHDNVCRQAVQFVNKSQPRWFTLVYFITEADKSETWNVLADDACYSRQFARAKWRLSLIAAIKSWDTGCCSSEPVWPGGKALG